MHIRASCICKCVLVVKPFQRIKKIATYGIIFKLKKRERYYQTFLPFFKLNYSIWTFNVHLQLQLTRRTTTHR